MKLLRTSLAASLLLSFLYVGGQSAVTNGLSGGRFGDNLISLFHALWVEYKFGIPILYKPFQFSDQLMLHEKRKRYKEKYAKKFTKIAELKENCTIEFAPASDTLFVIPYFPESMEEHRKAECSLEVHSNFSKGMTRSWPYIHVDWNDKRFIDEIRSLIIPRHQLNLLSIPTDCTTVAVHVRKSGGGFDQPILSDTPAEYYRENQQYSDVNYPLKCPPNSYYMEQINLLINLFKNRKLYIYIFTDDPNPLELRAIYAKAIRADNVIFDSRTNKNNNDSNVLEDFFSMLQFDCLIRSDSNFSLAASKIGKYSVVISPLHHTWVGRTLYIDKVALELQG